MQLMVNLGGVFLIASLFGRRSIGRWLLRPPRPATRSHGDPRVLAQQ